jgi:hypothetical protein
MSTDPSMPRPLPGSSAPPRTVNGTVTISSPGALIAAGICVLLGLALGIANQSADGTEMVLRVPALLAALLMVSQGLLQLRKSLPRQQRVEVVPEPETPGQPGQPGQRGRELAVVRALPPREPIAIAASVPSPATLSLPIAVMILAAWLGLADLRVDSPPALGTLSLLSAFALFALGWSLLPARRLPN